MSHSHNPKKRKLETADSDDDEIKPPKKKMKITDDVIKHKNKMKIEEDEDKDKDDALVLSTKDVMERLQQIFETIEQPSNPTIVGKSICCKGPKHIRPSVSNLERVTAEIDHVFQFWDPNEQCAVGIKLDHSYTDNELSENGVNALKATDFAKVHSLMQSKVAQSMVCMLCLYFRNRSEK